MSVAIGLLRIEEIEERSRAAGVSERNGIAHTLSFGGGFKPRFYTFADATNFGGTFTFSNLEEFAAASPALFQISSGNPRG